MTEGLRPSAVYAGIAVTRLMQFRGLLAPEAVAFLQQGNAQDTAYDYPAADQMAAEYGWGIFSHALDAQAAFRETIEAWMEREQPIWRDLLPLGRARALEVLSPNMRACFENAGLTGNDLGTLEWWDHQASIARQAIDQRLLELGREAERWTVDLETARLAGTGLAPVWVSIEDNGKGYDVLTFRQDADEAWRDQHVEVKYAGAISIHLTAKEWRFALEQEATWEMHIWRRDETEPAVLHVADLLPHMPENRGAGSWESTEVRLVFLVPDPSDEPTAELTSNLSRTTSGENRRFATR
ncbi:MAG: protein NO VEIN domain-containing protein [Candidatus Limnocylindrales bacterium]